MANENAAKKSKYSAGFFLRLLALLALLGFVLFEVNSAQKANETIGEVQNAFPLGEPVSKIKDVLKREPSSTRTESMTVDVEAMKKEIDEMQAKIDAGDLEMIEKSRFETKIKQMTPKLGTPEISYQIDTYRFLLNPFVGQYIEVAHTKGIIEKILINKTFTLDTLKSGLNVKESGRDAPLVAGGMGGRAPGDDDEEDEHDEDDHDHDEEDQ